MEIKGIEIYNSVKEAFAKHPNTILIHTQIGNCMVCGNRHDLRAGACFACCSTAPLQKLTKHYLCGTCHGGFTNE